MALQKRVNIPGSLSFAGLCPNVSTSLARNISIAHTFTSEWSLGYLTFVTCIEVLHWPNWRHGMQPIGWLENLAKTIFEGPKRRSNPAKFQGTIFKKCDISSIWSRQDRTILVSTASYTAVEIDASELSTKKPFSKHRSMTSKLASMT